MTSSEPADGLGAAIAPLDPAFSAPLGKAPGADVRSKAVRGKELRVLLLLMPAYGAMSAIFMGLQQIVIPAQVERFDPVHKIANLAAMTMVVAVTGVFGLLAGGALSDRTHGRFGRRAPWLAVMAILAAGLMIAMGAAPSLTIFAILYGLLWLALNLYQSAQAAMLPDRIAPEGRGVASSIMGIGLPVGVLIGVTLAARLPQAQAYAALAALFVVATAALLVFAREPAFARPVAAEGRRAFSLDPRRGLVFLSAFRHRDFALTFASRALLYLTIYSVTGYIYYVLQDRVGVANVPGHDLKVGASLLTSVQTLGVVVTIAAGGWIADKVKGRRLVVGLSAFGVALAMMIPAFNHSWTGMLVFSGLFGLCLGAFLAVDLALMSLVLPDKANEGRDLAILVVAGAVPQILSPMMAGALITAAGYEAVFLVGTLTAVIAGLLVFFIKGVR